MSTISPMKNKEKLLIDSYQLFNNAFDTDYLIDSFLKLIYSNISNLNRVMFLKEVEDVSQFTVFYEITDSDKSMLSMRVGGIYKELKNSNNKSIKLSNIKDDFLNSYGVHNLISFDASVSNLYKSFFLLSFNGDISLGSEEVNLLQTLVDEFKKCFLKLDQLEKSSGELKRLRLQNELLREQERLRSDFINNISHELRTPLSSVLGFSKILSSKKDTIASKEDLASHIQDSALRLSALVTDLIQATGTQSSWSVNLEMVDIRKIIKDSVEEFSLLNKDFKITYEIGSELKKIKSDPKLIRQVLDNLISNAIKYSVREKVISIKAGLNEAKKEFVFSVKDSGLGIEKDELHRLFDRFYRSSNPEIKTVKGAGLGLAISKEIIETLGGKISVESELDKGSKFIVTLPA